MWPPPLRGREGALRAPSCGCAAGTDRGYWLTLTAGDRGEDAPLHTTAPVPASELGSCTCFFGLLLSISMPKSSAARVAKRCPEKSNPPWDLGGGESPEGLR